MTREEFAKLYPDLEELPLQHSIEMADGRNLHIYGDIAYKDEFITEYRSAVLYGIGKIKK